MIDKIETAILNALRENFFDFEIDGFPVDFEKYTYTSPLGCLLVRFENSSASSQNTLTSVNAEETYNFTVFYSRRYAFRHSDAYGDLNKLKRILNGLEILNRRLVLSERNFEDEINGDLWYSYRVSIKLPIMDEHKDMSFARHIFNDFIVEEKINE